MMLVVQEEEAPAVATEPVPKPEVSALSRLLKRPIVRLLPALVFLAIFFIVPLIGVLGRSVLGPDGFTLEYLQGVLTSRSARIIFGNTVQIAALTTVACLVIGLPLAYYMAFGPKRHSRILLVIVMIPFMTSLLVRTYAWLLLLSSGGPLEGLLGAIGLGGQGLLYNRFAVIVAMTYVLLPYMVLTLYSVISGIDATLFRAAAALGANVWDVFRRVFLPLAAPGIVAGCLLVFVMGLGFFVTPRLVGGHSDVMVGMAIDAAVQQTLDWHTAAAYATILVIATVAALYLYDRLVGLSKLLESDRA